MLSRARKKSRQKLHDVSGYVILQRVLCHTIHHNFPIILLPICFGPFYTICGIYHSTTTMSYFTTHYQTSLDSKGECKDVNHAIFYMSKVGAVHFCLECHSLSSKTILQGMYQHLVVNLFSSHHLMLLLEPWIVHARHNLPLIQTCYKISNTSA